MTENRFSSFETQGNNPKYVTVICDNSTIYVPKKFIHDLVSRGVINVQPDGTFTSCVSEKELEQIIQILLIWDEIRNHNELQWDTGTDECLYVNFLSPEKSPYIVRKPT